MKIICKTNIDKWKLTKWPAEFVSAPRVGDLVRGNGPGDYKPELRVVEVIHTEANVYDGYGNPRLVPCIEVELHIPYEGMSLVDLGWDK